MKTFSYHTKHRTLLGDLHTPVGTYLKVRDIFPQSALMESSDYNSSDNNRSFIAFRSRLSGEISVDNYIRTLVRRIDVTAIGYSRVQVRPIFCLLLRRQRAICRKR